MKRILITVFLLGLVTSLGAAHAAAVAFTTTVDSTSGNISISLDSKELSGQAISAVSIKGSYTNPSVKFITAGLPGFTGGLFSGGFSSGSSTDKTGLTSFNISGSFTGATGPHLTTLSFNVGGPGTFAPNISEISINSAPATYASLAPISYGAPTQVTAIAGNQKAVVSWKASQGTVTSYTATSSNVAGDVASQKSCMAQSPSTSCEILGLTNNVMVHFTVIATGPGGTSNVSAPTDWVIPASSPLVGECGTAKGIPTNNSPNPLDLCLGGYPNTPSKDATGRFNWTCYGAGGGALINCASGVPLPIYPAPNVKVSVAVSSPSGKSGTIKSDPFGIDCGLRCDYSFTKNQRITLTVTPLPGAVFNGWSGACNNKKLSCSFSPKKDLKVTAKFK
ncbi:MAG: hypothetical protein EBT06_13695 [Gammaproteobacteria bacterium]|nr:hypothetical protein [Gammaproteobacteria bacterium]NBT45928.1 hypothetical protein [Gammaproteobacteria bacterium]NBY21410.1 hypothetical protein [Gammaproteobacteria bacterium]